MRCDIIIPIWNQLNYTKQCLASIIEHTRYPFRLIIIDNGSDKETRQYLESLKEDADIEYTLVRNEENLGWIKAVNQGLKMSEAPYACIMNNDTQVTDGWLGKMVRIAEKEPDIGLVNPSWEKPRRASVQSYAKFLEKYNGQYIEIDWCRGFCILIKQEAIKKVGFLDEIYGLGYYDDWDYSARAIKAGFRCVRAKDTFVYHHRNVSVSKRLKEGSWKQLLEKNKQIFYKRWGRPLRLVFILDKEFLQNTALNQFNDLWLPLLRDQHLIYIWSKRNFIYPVHSNMRFQLLPFNWIIFFRIWDNSRRNISKRYDAIFINNEKIRKSIQDKFSTVVPIFFMEANKNILEGIKNKVEILKGHEEDKRGK